MAGEPIRLDAPNQQVVRPYLTGADVADPGDAGEPTAEFDPSSTDVAGVRDYLEAHPYDVVRVLELEQAGRARKGVLELGVTDAGDAPEG